ncbi:MAG: fructosamine kinase [Rhodospirillaceae bacterium]|nr:MAG: fructosamine kinase [Rhodospirillaceae bacterium]
MTSLADDLEQLTGQRPDQISGLSGGCVGDVYQAVMPDGQTWVIKRGDADSGLEVEGRMLEFLAEHSDLMVPKVQFNSATLLVMDHLPNDGRLEGTAQHHAADLVAGLHSLTSPKGFGFKETTVIGGLKQANPWSKNWLDFFRDRRLMFMGHEAHRVGRLPSQILNRLENLCAQLPKWLNEPTQPSLLHGDMWSGNVLSARGRITGFIDPALYYGDPEIELAFTTLFHTFGPDFFDRYQEHRPLKPGFFEQRRDLYNLYPLLVHVRLFGGSYVQSVDRTLKQFGF